MILCDAGVLLCFVDRTQPSHRSYRTKFLALAQLNQKLLTTWPCFTEAMYLALGRGGWPMQAALGQLITTQKLLIFELSMIAVDRLFVLMQRYQDRPMDLADASLVLAAEQTGIRQILTTDSDFLFYRINDRDTFDVIAATP